MKDIQINGRTIIGEDVPAYIIAEMSANHAGSLERAKEIIHAAKEAGADCIKIQTYTPDTITMNCKNSYFQIQTGTWQKENLYDLYAKAYTPWEWQAELKEEADKVGIDFFSSPFDKTAVDFLEEIGVSFYKIASFELVDIPLLSYTASRGKPVILSTGMASLAEIEEAVEVIRSTGNDQLVLLRCASAYPAISAGMNLETMIDMKRRFDVPVGLSDHSMGSLAAVGAVAMGASVIEKHFCISRRIENPDSTFSMEPEEFAQMVREIRQIELAKGSVCYGPTAQESSNLGFRKSIFITKDVKCGDIFSEENIRVIRPGHGLHTREYEYVLGKKAACDRAAGMPLTIEDIEEFLTLSRADSTHEKLLFDWANDKEVRQQSFSSEQILWENHQSWYESSLKDPDRRIYIAYHGTTPVGMLRFDLEEEGSMAEISYSIAENFRKRGYGKEMIRCGIKAARKEAGSWAKIEQFCARVKPQNEGSRRIFEALGFQEEQTEGEDYVLYTCRCE